MNKQGYDKNLKKNKAYVPYEIYKDVMNVAEN